MKRIALGVVLAVLAAAVAGAADDTKAAKYEVEVVKDVAYHDAKDAAPVRHKLDLYLPKGAKDYPVLLYIHGGGWRRGSKDLYAPLGKLFAAHGIAFVAVNYRLSPAVKHPEHIKDVARAFAWVHKDMGKRGGDLKQLYVAGHSAGGHLCALLAADESYLKEHKLSAASIRGVIPISGVFRVSRRSKEVFEEEDGKKASPLTHVRKDLPPFLIFYADKERLGPQSEEFTQALKKAGATVELKVIKDRDHLSIVRKAVSPDDELTRAVFAFIKANGAAKKKE